MTFGRRLCWLVGRLNEGYKSTNVPKCTFVPWGGKKRRNRGTKGTHPLRGVPNVPSACGCTFYRCFKCFMARAIGPLIGHSPLEKRGVINPSKLGWLLKKNANRIIGGFEFKESQAEGRKAWRVLKVETPPLPALPPSGSAITETVS